MSTPRTEALPTHGIPNAANDLLIGAHRPAPELVCPAGSLPALKAAVDAQHVQISEFLEFATVKELLNREALTKDEVRQWIQDNKLRTATVAWLEGEKLV